MTRLRLLSRPGCHLCDRLRAQADEMLEGIPHSWEIVDVDSLPDLAARFGDAIPILFVGDRLFAKTRLPPIATRLRLRRAARAQSGE
ncbi:MAG: glutaredoxin family protein [Acidobacteriota bacterium]|nr:glutaredoxin family protein [Acidobacteriota bacterium]